MAVIASKKDGFNFLALRIIMILDSTDMMEIAQGKINLSRAISEKQTSVLIGAFENYDTDDKGYIQVWHHCFVFYYDYNDKEWEIVDCNEQGVWLMSNQKKWKEHIKYAVKGVIYDFTVTALTFDPKNEGNNFSANRLMQMLNRPEFTFTVKKQNYNKVNNITFKNGVFKPEKYREGNKANWSANRYVSPKYTFIGEEEDKEVEGLEEEEEHAGE
jgi:hypothetical protein